MPRQVREKADNYADLEEDQGGLLSMLITFVVLIAITALICTIIWKVTHKEPRAELGKVQVPLSQTNVSETLVSEDELARQAAESEVEIEPIDGDAHMVFEEVDEEVTAKDAAIIRTLPNNEGIVTVAGQLRNGQILKRIGINKETGWSKVMFNGQEGYIVSYRLTTNKEYKTKAPENPDNRVVTSDGYIILFNDCEDTVTTQEFVNLRTEPSTAQGHSSVSAQLKVGLTAKRTGISIDSGWSRVEFNGLVLYVATAYLKVVEE
jgi:uncharacterized protein YgiM (DUF1202 family)